MDITDRVVMITGAASGLGRATAQALARAGARLSLVDRDGERAMAVARDIGPQAIGFACDVTEEASVEAAFASTLDRLGPCAAVVTCAGVPDSARTLSKGKPHPLDRWKRVIDVNLTGTFNVLRLAAVQMETNPPNEHGERGVIVCCASGAAFEGQIGQAAYAASKAGVVGLTLPVARDLADVGIRCVTIAPGLFDTPMVAGLPDPVRDAMVERMVVFPKRLGVPEEFARLACHIIDNPYINGTTLRIDAASRLAPK